MFSGVPFTLLSPTVYFFFTYSLAYLLRDVPPSLLKSLNVPCKHPRFFSLAPPHLLKSKQIISLEQVTSNWAWQNCGQQVLYSVAYNTRCWITYFFLFNCFPYSTTEVEFALFVRLPVHQKQTFLRSSTHLSAARRRDEPI